MTAFQDSQDFVENLDCTDVQSLCRQIRSLKHRAAQAEMENRALRELAEHIHEVFWMTTPLGDELIYISPAYEAIWGQTCDSLYADPGRRLAWVHDADREHVLKAFKRDARAGCYDETFRIDRPDGQVRWIRDQAWPVYDDHGALYRLAGFANDVTEQIAAYDRTRDLSDQLASRDRIEVFAALGAGIAHDMAQPLTAARSHLARGHRAGSLEACRAAAEDADGEVRRASDIVRHLRDYARQGELKLTWHHLDDILNDLHRLMDTALRGAGIDYSVNIDAPTRDTRIAVDHIFLQQILRNLVQNAIDAHATSVSPSEPPRIEIAVRLIDSHDIEFRISDNGPGIADQNDPFTAFDTQKRDGLGMGLYVSRSLARTHGGELSMLDDTNTWATVFVLRLPCGGDSVEGALDSSQVEDVSAVGASRA